MFTCLSRPFLYLDCSKYISLEGLRIFRSQPEKTYISSLTVSTFLSVKRQSGLREISTIFFDVVSSFHSIVMLSPKFWEVYVPVYLSNIRPGPMPGRSALQSNFVNSSLLVSLVARGVWRGQCLGVVKVKEATLCNTGSLHSS